MVFAPAPWCEDIKGFWWCRMDRNSPCRTPAGSKHPETLAKESVETVSCRVVAARWEVKPDMLSTLIAYNIQETESNCGTITKHASTR